jgi:plastocyanin
MRTMKLLMLGAMAGILAIATARAATIEVGQKDKTFAPDTLTAPVGSTIHIKNDDEVVHNVIVTVPGVAAKNTGIQKPGENMDLVLDKLGEYQVKCGIHPKMKMTIQVQ